MFKIHLRVNCSISIFLGSWKTLSICIFKFYFQKVFVTIIFGYYISSVILFFFFTDYILDLLCLCILHFLSNPLCCFLDFIFISVAVLIPWLDTSYYIISKISSPWASYNLVFFFPEMICLFLQFLLILTNSSIFLILSISVLIHNSFSYHQMTV